MGMFDSSQPFDPMHFNYASEQDKLKRKRAIADGLMLTKQPGTQTVPGGSNGLVVRNSALTNLAPMIQQIVGAYLSGKADDDQKALDKNSLDAFGKQFGGLNDKVRDPAQDGVEAAAEMSREARRGQGVDTSPDATPAPDEAQTFPVSPGGQIISQDLPVASVSAKAKPLPLKQAAALLSGSGIDSVGHGFNQSKDSAAANVPNDPNLPSDNSIIAPGAWDNLKNIGAAAKAKIGAALQGIQHFTGADGSVPNIAPSQPAPVAPPQTALQGAPPVPAMPAPQQAQPVPPMPQAPQGQPPVPPMAPPAMPTPQPQAAPPIAAQPQGMAPQGPISDADPYSKSPSQQEQITRLIALGRTGPEGQQIANAQLNQMFASKNGRFTTQVHADPVNGGFIKVTTDTATGQTQVNPITASGGNEKVLETKVGSDGNMLERTNSGWRKASMQGGGAVMTQEGQAAQAKDADLKAADQAKIADLQSDYDRVKQLVPLLQEVGTGRLQTPFNNAKSFVTDSTKLDTLNRLMNTEALQARIQFMHGQGSVSDADARDAKSASMNPNASTQSNIDAANVLLGVYKRGLDREQEKYNSKYGSGGSTSAAPASGMMYSWQKK